MEVAMRQDVTLREEYVLKIWDRYIFDNLVETIPCKAAIYDYKARRLIVCSHGFHLLDCELDSIIEGMEYPDLAYKNGINVKSRKYGVRLADGKNGIYAKDGEDGCTVCKTVTFLIIGVHDARVNSETCNVEIMKLGDFFRQMGL